MVYFLGYLSVGMFLVILKSPIRKLVDWEVADMQMHCLIQDEDIHVAKLFLFRVILSFIIITIYPIILYRKLVDYYNYIIQYRNFNCYPIESEPGWLLGEISKENAEAINMVKIDGCNVAFGYNNTQWRNVLELMEEGDKLYEFRSLEESWKCFSGKEGLALVRKGVVVADIVILLN